jgi:uncharacterized protein DUF6089
MKKIFFLSALLLPLLSFSQRLHLNLFGGFANYQGDLQEKFFTLDQSNGAFGAGLKYDLTSHLSLRTGLMYGKVSADDKKNKPSLQMRNLNFQSKIVEGNLLLEYNLFDLDEKRFTPYAFAGIALYHFNPFSYDSMGTKIFLHPLSTEGQGISGYDDRKPYKLTQFSIPFGGGLKLRVSDNVVIAYEIGLRKLRTDYLDDASTTYVDPVLLFAAKGPKAVEMSYRGDEVKNGDPNYPAPGTVRGSAKQKDLYYFQGISINIGINTANGARPGRSRLDCPNKVL